MSENQHGISPLEPPGGLAEASTVPVSPGADIPEAGDKWSLPLVRLGDLGADTVIDEAGLARMFGKCRTSIKRAVARGELPAPVKMFGQCCWTADALAAHIRARMEKAQKDALRLSKRPV